MFKRFLPAELDELFRAFPLPAPTMEIVRRALIAPARVVKGTTRNMVADLPCPKMGGMSQAESMTVEASWLLQHVYDPDIALIATQPFVMSLRYAGKHDRTIQTTHVPDALICSRTSGFFIEEYKPASAVDTLPRERVGRYEIDRDGILRSYPAEAAGQAMGLQYRIRLGDEISRTRVQNQRELFVYLSRSAEHQYLAASAEVVAILADEPFVDFLDLAKRCSMGADVVKFALAWGIATFDIDNRLISQPQEVAVFRNEDALHAYRISIGQPPGALPLQVYSKGSFAPGTTFTLVGVPYRVQANGLSELIGANEVTGAVESFSHRDLELHYVKRKLFIPHPVNSLPSNLSRSKLHRASPAEVTRAIARFGTYTKWVQGEPLLTEEKLSDSTFRRYKAAVEATRLAGLPILDAFISRAAERGFRGPHIDLDLSALIDERITHYLSQTNAPSGASIYHAIHRELKQAGKPMVAKSTFYRRLTLCQTLSTLQASRGHKFANQFEPNYILLQRETPIRTTSSMEEVHIDHTLLDQEQISSISGRNLGRPWLSVAIDERSRRVLAFHLTYFPPSYRSVLMLLLGIVENQGRLPDAIVHDWGSEFRAIEFMRVLQACDIRRYWRPKGKPRFGNVIERLFGSLQSQLTKNQVGNTKALRNVRTSSMQLSPALLAGSTLADCHQTLGDYFFKEYDTAQHPAHHRTPREVYESSFTFGGEKSHRRVRADDMLPLLLPIAKGGRREVSGNSGVVHNYEHYGHPAFAKPGYDGLVVPVKALPYDSSRILAFFDGQWNECRSKHADEFASMPEVFRRTFSEDLRMEYQFHRKDHKDFGLRVAELLATTNAKAMANRDYLKDKDARRFIFELNHPRHDLITPADRPSLVRAKAAPDLKAAMEAAIERAKASDQLGKLAK